jgi:molecular chaperone GrpE
MRPASEENRRAEGARAAGPVPGSGPSSSQAAGEDPNPAPPAAGAAEPSGADQAPPGAARDERAAQDGGAAQVEGDLDSLLADVQKERDEYLELARRTKADFENFRKRMTAEVQAAGVRGKAQIARDVVPVLDDLERAIQAAGLDPEGDSEDGLAHGVLLVFRGLREALTRNGIEAVDPTGEKFDPNQHEALSTLAVEGKDSGRVVETMQKGYRFGDQLIRPARVVVSE